MKYRKDYTLFRRKGQKVWYFQVWEGRKRIARTTGKVKKGEAEDYVKSFLSGKDLHPITLREFATGFFDWTTSDWIKRQHAKERSFSRSVARSCKGHLIKYILPKWGDRLLSEINASEVESWLVGLPLANQTKNHILYMLRILLREAKFKKYVRENPLLEVEPLGASKNRRDVFTLDDLRALFPVETDKLVEIWGSLEYAAVFFVLGSCGLRSGELRALAWQHVIRGKNLYIERAVKDDETIGPTKTDRPRVAWLFPRTRTVLAWWKDQSP